jgi:hypothetical protein
MWDLPTGREQIKNNRGYAMKRLGSAHAWRTGLWLNRVRIVCGASLLILTGCNVLGTIQERAEALNTTAADYASAAILYNVVRASKAEPLNFVSLSAFTGHQTASIGIGLPNIIIGADRTTAQNLFIFGPNSISGSESNDFNVGVIDDPASYAALLKPADPATLGFILSQSYDPALVLFLFVSYIQIVNTDGSSMVYENDPFTVLTDADVTDQSACATLAGNTAWAPPTLDRIGPMLFPIFLL